METHQYAVEEVVNDEAEYAQHHVHVVIEQLAVSLEVLPLKPAVA